MTERNWYEDNWELQQEVGKVKTVQATQGRDIEHHKELIGALTINQDRIYSKLDKLSGKVMIMVGIGIVIEIVLPYVLHTGGK